MRSVAVGGTCYRVADPRWDDPLDPGHAAVSGQRWNPPGVACLYLNDDVATARNNIVDRYAGLPYGPEDLDPAEAPVLIVVEVPAGRALDAVSDEGLAAVGLPITYPLDTDGTVVAHSVCQPIGTTARHRRPAPPPRRRPQRLPADRDHGSRSWPRWRREPFGHHRRRSRTRLVRGL